MTLALVVVLGAAVVLRVTMEEPKYRRSGVEREREGQCEILGCINCC